MYVYNPADYTIIDGEEKDYVEIDGTRYELHDYEEVRFTNAPLTQPTKRRRPATRS